MSASLPIRQQSQRRAAPDGAVTAPQPPTTSQTSAPSDGVETAAAGAESASKEEQSIADAPEAAQGNGEEEKKCWICFADATEDTADSSPWRSPCPCALVAHEACLLDWIADMEAPNRSRARSVTAPRIECPQCKSEIQLSRPRSVVVSAVRSLERLGARAVTPGALTVLFGTVYQSSVALGIHTIYAIFGADDGFAVLRPLLVNRIHPPIDLSGMGAQQVGERAVGVVLDHLVHWRLYVGLPLITPILILSRTTVADSVLPVLPIVFFASQATLPDDVVVFGNWPPSAWLSFALLPYVRAAYNAYYRYCWAEKEERWLREIQPRATQDTGGDADDALAGNDEALINGEDANVFEIRVDGGIFEEWEEDEEVEEVIEQLEADLEQQQQREGQAADEGGNDAVDPAAQQEDAPQAAGNAEGADAQPGQAQQPARNAAGGARDRGGAERRLSFSPTAIAETILGALLFPTIASLSGELIRLVLPLSWTTLPVSRLGLRGAPRGILQQKWGRSLVGGCLFVVLKDTVMLYVRWKMAQMHRKRQVLDYDRAKAKAK